MSFPYIHSFPCRLLETLRPLQEVRSVASESGGKFYLLPPDKENTR